MRDGLNQGAKRCAIYTRKSHENGLQLDYNSLDAQRDICLSQIKARAHDGWEAIETHYDDGGVSGGTTDRPALKALEADIIAGKVDLVVTQRIDRLSRSLLDFYRLIAFFEKHKVMFVSISEDFNTTTAMGRCALNLIMVFAEFEREVASERVKNKIAAAKRKGRWTGGVVPYGYRSDDSNLHIEESEAAVVRMIFQRFIALGSGTELSRELEAEAVVNRNGNPFDKGSLCKMLANRVYVGDVGHKGEWFKGLHDPIIDPRTWERKEAIIARAPRTRAGETRGRTPALLKGIIYGPTGHAMSPTWSKGKRGQQYRYYVDATLLKGAERKHDSARVSAGQVEEAVVERLRTIIARPETIMATHRALRAQGGDVSMEALADQLRTFDGLWERLFPREQARIARLLLERVDVSDEGLEVTIRTGGFAHLALELAGATAPPAPAGEGAR